MNESIRASGGQAHGFGSDARDEAAVTELVARIEREIAPIEVAVFNIGANVRFAVTDTTERVYRKVCEAYWQLHRQPRSAWTHEMDLRPWMETW